jgi:autotransporter-associated beta strand protein
MIQGQTRPMLEMEYNNVVSNAHQLQLIDFNPTGLYTLANNIDASGTTNASDVWGTTTTNGGSGFISLGNLGSAPGFSGVLNGDSHIVNNLYFSTSSSNTGFVGTLSGTIENLGMTNVKAIANGAYDFGAMVGFGTGIVKNSFVTGAVIDTGAYVGGLWGDSYGIIENSYANVLANSSGVGALLGNQQGGAVINSYGAGYVTGYGGGLIYSGSHIVNGYYDATTIGQSGGGTALTTTQMMQSSNLVGFDFTNTWAILPGQSYPYLMSFYPTTPQVVSGTTDLSGGNAIQLASNGNNLTNISGGQGTTYTGANGFYYFLEPNNTLISGSSLIAYYYNDASVGVAITKVSTLNASLTGLNIATNTVSVGDSNANQFSNSYLLLSTTQGNLDSNTLLYSGSGSTLTLNSGIGFETNSGATYTLDGTLTGQTAGMIDGSLIFNGPVILGVDAAFNTGSNPITFASTIDSMPGNNYNLTLTTSDTTSLLGSIGATTPLASLAVNGGGPITLASPIVTTVGDQIYGGAVALGASDAFLQSATGNLEFDGDITWSTANNLSLSAANYIYLNGNITAPAGTLTLSALNNAPSSISIGDGTIGSDPSAYLQALNVNNFIFLQGQWEEFVFSSSLPDFNVTNNFEIATGNVYNNAFNAQFMRFFASRSALIISDIYGLQGIASGYITSIFSLSQDIDANATSRWANGFIGIGNATTNFDGDLNGHQHNIIGLTINGVGNDGNTTGNNLGLFGYIGSFGTVENLGLVAENITGTLNNSSAGGLAGYNAGAVSNTFTTGQMSSTIAGSGNASFGGLVGTNSGSITDSYSTMAISIDAQSGSSDYDVGGFVGNNLSGSNIQNTYSAGPVVATSGGSFNGSITQGGFAAANSGTITDSYYDSQVSLQGNQSAGGAPETTAQMMQQATFPNFDFTNIWGIAEGTSYPYLQGFALGGGVPIVISGTVPLGLNGSLVDLISNGSFLLSTQVSGNQYVFLIGSGSFAGNDNLLIYFDGASDYANAVGKMASSVSSLSGFNLHSGTISIYGSDMSNTALVNAVGSLSSDGILYSASNNGTGYDLTLGNGAHPDVNFVTPVGTGYTLDGSIVNNSGVSNVTFNGPVTLTTEFVNISAPSGSIVFNSTIDGATDLILTSSNNVLKGNVGASAALNSLDLEGGGTDEIDASSITTNNYQNYGDALLLSNANLTLTANGTSGPNPPTINNINNYYSFLIGFNSTVDSTSDGLTNLTLTGIGAGTYTTNGNIGSIHPLASFTAANTITFLGGGVTTTGDQFYEQIGVESYNVSGQDINLTARNVTSPGGIQVDFNGGAYINNFVLNLSGTDSEIDTGIGYQINNFVQNGGYLTISGNVNNQPITVNGGTLNINTSLSLPDVRIQAGGSLNLDNAEVTFQGLTLYGETGQDTLTASGNSIIDNGGFMYFVGASIGVANAATLTLHNSFGGDTLTKDGLGTLILTGGGGSQALDINAGMVSLTNGSALEFGTATVNTGGILQIDGTSSSVDVNYTSVVLNGGTLQGIGTAAFDNGMITINANSTITAPNASDTLTIGTSIDSSSSVPAALAINGQGSVTLTGDVGDSFPLLSLTSDAATALTINNSNIQTTGDQTYSNDISVTSSPTLTANNVSFGNIIGSGGDLSLVLSGDNSVISGTVSNTNNLYLNGTGYLTLSGDNSGTPLDVQVSDGILHLTNTSRLGDQATFSLGVTGGEVLFDNANIDLSSNNNTVTLYGGSLASIGNSSLNAGIIYMNLNTIMDVTNGTFTLNAPIANHRSPGSIIKNGNGTLVMTNSGNRFSGGATINAGVLSVTDPNALGFGDVTVNSGGDLNLNNIDLDSIAITLSGSGVSGEGALTATGNASVTNSTITLNADATMGAPTAQDTLTISNPIDGAAGLTLTGAGTINLSADVGDSTPINSLNMNVATINISTPNITTTGNQLYSTLVNFGGDATLSSVSGNISFTGGVNGLGDNLMLAGTTGNTFSLSGPLLLNSLTVTGGVGATLSMQSNYAQNWNITAPLAGSIAGISTITDAVNFTGIQNVVGTSHAANDFIFSDGAVLGNITGGNTAFVNTLDVSAYASIVSIALNADYVGSASTFGDAVVASGFSQIQNLVGQTSFLAQGQGSILVTSALKTNTITLLGAGSGVVNDPMTFSGFGSYQGSGSDNTIIIAVSNIYNPNANTVTINGITMSLSNIQIVTGGNSTGFIQLPPPPVPTPSSSAPSSSAPSSSAPSSPAPSSPSSSSQSQSTATQAVVSANYSQTSSSSSSSSSSSGSSSQRATNSYDISNLVVTPTVSFIITNLEDIAQQQTTLDLTINNNTLLTNCD